MEPSEKSDGAARGQNAPSCLRDCAAGRPNGAVYPSAVSGDRERLGRAVEAGSGAGSVRGPQATCLGNGLSAESRGGGVCALKRWRIRPRSCGGSPWGAMGDRALTFHFGWDLEEERRTLKEDQKICRSRAQKYLLETNRRRRAFEERRKQEEEKEQKIRQQILQQRKIKLQEATDKFQRAHRPCSQYKQIALIPLDQTKAAFQLEEALVQIKGAVVTPGLYLPSKTKTNIRTTDDTSSSSASRNSSFHQKQISAMVGWDKTIQESCRTNMDSNQLLFQKNLKEMQQLLEKQHLSNLENFHQEVEKTDDSESLSSLDSLEAGEPNGNYTTRNESSLTTRCDCALYNPEKSQTGNNVLLHTAHSTSCKNVHLNNCLRNTDSQYYHSSAIQDLLAKRNVLTPAEHVNNSEEKSSTSHSSGKKTTEFSTSGKQESSGSNAFTSQQNIKEDRNKPSSGSASTLATDHPLFNPNKDWANPDSIPGGRVQDLMQEESFKMIPQKRTVSVQTSSQSIATSTILFPNQGCSTGIPSTAGILPKDKNISTEFIKNTLGKMAESKEENIKCIDDIKPGSSLYQYIPNASVLCHGKQQNNNEQEKRNTVATVSLVSDTEFNSGTPTQHKTLKNNSLGKKRVKLFRSILKDDSKYEATDFKAIAMNHGINFGTQPMSSIRDSLELAKRKKKSAENEKYNRKLRWCDEISQIITENNDKCYAKNASERSSAQLQYVQTSNNVPKTNLSVIAQPSDQEDFLISKPNVNTEDSNEEFTSLNMCVSSGAFSTKKACVVSKDEEINPLICSNNSKINESNQLKNRAKITRRATSIKARSSFIPGKRRGTIIQPQSATEANRTQRAPGKLLAPHPPSAPLPGRSGKNEASPGCPPLLRPSPRSDLNERHIVLEDCALNRIGTENSEGILCPSDLGTVIPAPGCSAARYEPWAKQICSVNSAQTRACQDRSVTCTQGRPANAENGLHLHHSPAAGKTSPSWRGVHTARAPKDSATGVGPVTRQKQGVDNYDNKHRAFSVNRRQNVASTRWKPTHHAQNSLHTVQLRPLQSAFDPVHYRNNTYKSNEVSESTVQFLIAEKLASTNVAEDVILAAMESVHPASQPLLFNRTPCPWITALSIEEQKIFQSLDRLNQKLRNVQEAIARNQSASDVLQITTPLGKSLHIPQLNYNMIRKKLQLLEENGNDLVVLSGSQTQHHSEDRDITSFCQDF
ncbi:centrosomal protein of 126 kDa [Dryobates pubescens]|uniref:centrosomal protein of 126 kDa n=1 Tax=Dryobates pubescens TaxID=118200 RepID=UPI0023BA261B|nr:centrosomal protein of 126 kDa [Dryobates pubescens]